MTITLFIFHAILFISNLNLTESKRRSSDQDGGRISKFDANINICHSCSAEDRTCARDIPIPCASSTSSESGDGSDYLENNLQTWKSNKISWGRGGLILRRRNARQRNWSDPRDNSFRSSYPGEKCTQKESFRCRYFKCFDTCCNGWSKDPVTGTCTIKNNSPMSITCQNGGTITRTMDGPVCVCRPFYTGRSCETVLCLSDCENGGICDLIDGVARCVCQDGFQGNNCEIPICKSSCLNGGVCVSDDDWSVPYCNCQYGYSGKTCQHSNYRPKSGLCPVMGKTMMVNAGVCMTSCDDDNDCNGDHKCCLTGCGASCMMPSDDFCKWNGTKYDIGDCFLPTSCLVCTCYDPDNSQEYGGATCTSIPCPPLLPGCANVKVDTCCKTCIDHLFLTKTASYKEPIFTNCPVTTLEINLPIGSNSADLPIKLRAKDYLKHKLDVRYSGTRFSVGEGGLTYHTVTASSSLDSMGNRAVCIFQIRLKDRQPPMFKDCPTDITSSGEKVTWKLPTATDNVGLAIQPFALSMRKPGDKFSLGEHTVVYKTVDYEGNEANCIFIIKISKPDLEKEAEERSAQLKSSSIQFYSIGVASFTVLIILALVIFGFCFRSKRPRLVSMLATDVDDRSMVLTTQDRRTHSAVDNIYSTHNDFEPPPAYDYISKLNELRGNGSHGSKMVEKEYMHHIIPTITPSSGYSTTPTHTLSRREQTTSFGSSNRMLRSHYSPATSTLRSNSRLSSSPYQDSTDTLRTTKSRH